MDEIILKCCIPPPSASPLEKAGLLSSDKFIKFFNKIGKFFDGVLYGKESIEPKDIHHYIAENGSVQEVLCKRYEKMLSRLGKRISS
jgi:hypothetical protein